MRLHRELSEVFENLGGAKPAGDAPAAGAWIVGKAREGDAVALAALRRVAVHVGGGFANIIRALNPEAIVVGDYLALGWDLMQDVVWDVLRARVHQHYLSGLRIVPSEHAADSSLLGAVALVLSRFLTTFSQAESNSAHSVLIRASGV